MKKFLFAAAMLVVPQIAHADNTAECYAAASQTMDAWDKFADMNGVTDKLAERYELYGGRDFAVMEWAKYLSDRPESGNACPLAIAVPGLLEGIVLEGFEKWKGEGYPIRKFSGTAD